MLTKLNLGSGADLRTDYINVDKNPKTKADVCTDLAVLPWDWADNSFTEILALHVLEHIAAPSLVDIIIELYRISQPRATWKLAFPHHRSDQHVGDPTHVRALHYLQFAAFDQTYNTENLRNNYSNSSLGLDLDIDLEITSLQYNLSPRFAAKNLDKPDLEYYSEIYSNVIESVDLEILVHKPGRLS